MDGILEILRTLRAPDGCPWDRKQTFATLRPYLLEEVCEALDALHEGDDVAIVEELGDVLLIVAFFAVIADEEGRWSFADVTNALADKLHRRHPHVFGDMTARDTDDVVAIWQTVKAAEKRDRSERPDVDAPPVHLPALARAAAWHARRGPGSTSGSSPERAPDADGSRWGDRLYDLAARVSDEGFDPELVLRDAVARKIRKASTT